MHPMGLMTVYTVKTEKTNMYLWKNLLLKMFAGYNIDINDVMPTINSSR